jgi:hypothetical protein
VNYGRAAARRSASPHGLISTFHGRQSVETEPTGAQDLWSVSCVGPQKRGPVAHGSSPLEPVV